MPRTCFDLVSAESEVVTVETEQPFSAQCVQHEGVEVMSRPAQRVHHPQQHEEEPHVPGAAAQLRPLEVIR